MFHTALRLARHYEAAGDHPVADVLDYGVRLSRDEGLVHFAASLHDDPVRAHLPAGGKLRDVVEHDVFDCDLARFALSYHHGFWRGEQRKSVHGALRAQFLDYADESVEHYENEKAEIAYPVHARGHESGKQYRKDDEYEVEKGQDIRAQYLGHALGAHRLFAVDFACGDALAHFFVAQSLRGKYGSGRRAGIGNLVLFGHCQPFSFDKKTIT